MTVFRMGLIIVWALYVGLLTSCTTPPYVDGLDRILARQSLDNRDRLKYRCTAGAHRGDSTAHRENSMAALLAADENDRYAFIEFDVQYSKDMKIIVYHDKRMLRLFGSLKAIGETSVEDLKVISSGEIAEYREAMDRMNKKVNIEIKSQGDDEEDRQLVDEIMADIRARKREKDVLISSISRQVVAYVSRRYPDIATGQVFWLTSSTYLHFDGLTQNLFDEIHQTQADYLILYQANLRNIDNLIRLKPRNKTIMFWDFDDTIFIVHKDLSDRLWGTSSIGNLFQSLKYRLSFSMGEPN